MNIKDTLFTAAFELFLKYGIKSVSMDDISRKIGISKKTIYNFVTTKDDLIANVLEKHLQNDAKAITDILKFSTDAIDEMVKISQHVISFLRNMSPSIIYDLQKYHPSSWKKIESIHFTFIEKTILNNIIRGQKEGLYRLDLDPKIISKLYVYKTTLIVDQDKFSSEEFDKIILFKEMIKYHLHAIVSDRGKPLISKIKF